MVGDLLTSVDLPAGFDYPAEFMRVVELGLTDLEPWWIFDGDQLRQRMIGLHERYPGRQLVPSPGVRTTTMWLAGTSIMEVSR